MGAAASPTLHLVPPLVLQSRSEFVTFRFNTAASEEDMAHNTIKNVKRACIKQTNKIWWQKINHGNESTT